MRPQQCSLCCGPPAVRRVADEQRQLTPEKRLSSAELLAGMKSAAAPQGWPAVQCYTERPALQWCWAGVVARGREETAQCQEEAHPLWAARPGGLQWMRE